jgi:hypothetical protein
VAPLYKSISDDVIRARKFVLDTAMSRYLADLSQSFWRGGQRKRLLMLENARHEARLPYPLTWIEYDHLAYCDRLDTAYGADAKDTRNQPPRNGWLFQQHPQVTTCIKASEVFSDTDSPDHVIIHPVSACWSTDDTLIPWKSLWKTSPWAAAVAAGAEGYYCPFVLHTATYTEEMAWHMMDIVDAIAWKTIMRAKNKQEKAKYERERVRVKLPTHPIGTLWALLATLHDLPVLFEDVKPAHGFTAPTSYQHFRDHKIVHLTVPETRYRRLVAKTAKILKRRAHPVSSHFRIDWRNPPNKTCDHVWYPDGGKVLKCEKCSGRKIDIPAHWRGDPNLGWVTHDYEVHHGGENGR